MSTRRASCSCGQLSLTCQGEPVRISVCHCLACQRRTGSAFAVQARFPHDQVTAIEGRNRVYTRIGDEGGAADFHFCPDCGSTVFYELAEVPGFIAVPVGGFADPAFPAPYITVYESRAHPWAKVEPDGAVERHA